jgi:NAD+ kinase
MKITIYGTNYNTDFNPYIKEFFQQLHQHHVEYQIYKPFYDFICQTTGNNIEESVFDSAENIMKQTDFMVSIGGDGTFLKSLPYVRNYNIPIIGLNSGRLGFLANIAKEELSAALAYIFESNYQLEERNLIEVLCQENLFGDLNYALNEVTIQKKESSMITINAYLDNELLNTYWTDGLIISTPTGSTAYSLSVGGPIVLPGSNNLIIAPIASHNLTVRPLVIPDDKTVKLDVKTRDNVYLITADNRTVVASEDLVVTIKKASFTIKMLQLPKNNFYSTLRNKLMWGADIRN